MLVLRLPTFCIVCVHLYEIEKRFTETYTGFHFTFLDSLLLRVALCFSSNLYFSLDDSSTSPSSRKRWSGRLRESVGHAIASSISFSLMAKWVKPYCLSEFGRGSLATHSSLTPVPSGFRGWDIVIWTVPLNLSICNVFATCMYGTEIIMTSHTHTWSSSSHSLVPGTMKDVLHLAFVVQHFSI